MNSSTLIVSNRDQNIEINDGINLFSKLTSGCD